MFVCTGALFGGILGGFFLQYGRRRLLTLMSVPFSLSWLVTVFAKSVETMCATAFVGGFCCSIVSMVTQVCMREREGASNCRIEAEKETTARAKNR